MRKDKALVSVIIPAYKAEKFIKETLQSVLSQTHTALEVIIVDDGSPDSQEKVINPLLKSDKRVKYVKQRNEGVSSARNHGFKLSSGEYVAFLDADDIWLPNNIEAKLEKFKTGNFGLVHSDAEVINENSERTEKIKYGKEGQLLDDLLLWNGTCIPTPSSVLIKRSVLDNIGMFNVELSNAADQELFFRVADKFSIGRVPKVTWFYRDHSNNMHKNISLMESDELKVYSLASKNKLFKSTSFERQCYSNMYLILAASWWGDGKNKLRGLFFLTKSLILFPRNMGKVFQKIKELI